MISIEDFLEDIVGKAMRGHRISAQDLATESGISSSSLRFAYSQEQKNQSNLNNLIVVFLIIE